MARRANRVQGPALASTQSFERGHFPIFIDLVNLRQTFLVQEEFVVYWKSRLIYWKSRLVYWCRLVVGIICLCCYVCICIHLFFRAQKYVWVRIGLITNLLFHLFSMQPLCSSFFQIVFLFSIRRYPREGI
jgi:hypothetical protein